MKTYISLKDMPDGLPAGTKYKEGGLGYFSEYTFMGRKPCFAKNMVENNPEWFEERKEVCVTYIGIMPNNSSNPHSHRYEIHIDGMPIQHGQYDKIKKAIKDALNS